MQEVVDGVSSISLRKPWLEGRKMAARKMFGKDLEKEIISGAHRCDGKCEFEGRRDFSDTSRSSSHEIKGGHSIDDEASNKSFGRFHYQNNKKKMQSQDSNRETKPSNDEKVEAERLIMATKELVNFMHKDYKGMGKPRRKPPINNHEPRH
ncbi:hypothetical protein JRO89_XS12G0222200 [Xanthoceras sorbifolium]|uniref:Uncharacterized protein n=1 Tax=Xanthoceras sorbifolium TaxID=99658 RepID=A0ABQ8HD99_9ROSI|nr:hypothetical protein JRO89_XS12G0222200 [Xanthoceras sorbifolium]